MVEVLYSRLLSARCRYDISNVLCDYRYKLDPDSLPVLLQIWVKINRAMVNSLLEAARKNRLCIYNLFHYSCIILII